MQSIFSQSRRSFVACIGSLSALAFFESCRKHNSSEVVPTLAFLGDSLTAGTGGIAYGNLVGEALGRHVVVDAIGGQNAEQISVRQGGKVLTITLDNNKFIGELEVKITKISTQFLSTGSNSDIIIRTGTLLGIKCTIKRAVTLSGTNQVEHYTITPSISSQLTVPPDSEFILDNAIMNRTVTQVLWYGRNDFYTNRTDLANASSDIIHALDSSIAYLSDPKRFLVVGLLLQLSETKGSARYNAIIAHNALLFNRYSTNYVEMKPPTDEEMNAIEYTATTLDKTDITNGVFPTGMRSDNTHLNSKGYQIVAARVEKMCKLKNY